VQSEEQPKEIELFGEKLYLDKPDLGLDSEYKFVVTSLTPFSSIINYNPPKPQRSLVSDVIKIIVLSIVDTINSEQIYMNDYSYELLCEAILFHSSDRDKLLFRGKISMLTHYEPEHLDLDLDTSKSLEVIRDTYGPLDRSGSNFISLPYIHIKWNGHEYHIAVDIATNTSPIEIYLAYKWDDMYKLIGLRYGLIGKYRSVLTACNAPAIYSIFNKQGGNKKHKKRQNSRKRKHTRNRNPRTKLRSRHYSQKAGMVTKR
jgi:hypothetical protein